MLVNVILAVMTLASPIIDGMGTDEDLKVRPLVDGVFDIMAKAGISQLKKGHAAVCHNTD